MHWLILFLLPIFLIAQQSISPEQIQAELNEAEAQYEHALTLFNPWYTGPLITASATMVPPGHAMWQPYIYFTDNYGAFNKERESVDAPNQFIVKAQPVILQIGITPTVDSQVVLGTLAQWKKDEFSGGVQDLILQIGFQVNAQTLYAPKAKFSVGQSFPIGKYKNLDPEKLGLDGTGGGAWQTTFTMTFGKVMFWSTAHPLNTRLSFQYTVSTPVQVTNFNVYGGGYGTKGVAHPGNTLAAQLGLELSINQPWVAALDVVYQCSNRTSFSGKPGTTTPSGTTAAPVGVPYNDFLALAPAIEYNFNANMGILWGAYFTVYGRSTSNFVQGIFSWYWVFP